MRKGEQTRNKVIEAASRLFEKNGYAATGLKQVLVESGAPRGSLYFHFPGGKEELAAAVVHRHATLFGGMLTQIVHHAPSTIAAAELCVDGLAQRFEDSDCTTGCPVTVVALEMAGQSELLRTATASAFAGWTQIVAQRLIADGLKEADATARARALLAAIEGALILCRAYGHRGPLDDVKAVLPHLLAA